MPRADFAAQVAIRRLQPSPTWRFEPVYWNEVLTPKSSEA
jgi:leucyl/phenylalanyl-tRNA--protein transferase